MSRLNQDRVADERASRNGRVARVAAVFVLVAIAVGIGWHAWRGKVVPALPRIDLAGVDTRRWSNHDLVKETVTLLWYAALD